MCRSLRVINMNQQSDSTDLLGGYKPVDISHTMHNILESFTKGITVPFRAFCRCIVAVTLRYWTFCVRFLERICII